MNRDARLIRTLQSGHCPGCAGVRFWRGPQGGLSVNVKCDQCGAAFNVTVRDRVVIFAQSIPPANFLRYGTEAEPLIEAATARTTP